MRKHLPIASSLLLFFVGCDTPTGGVDADSLRAGTEALALYDANDNGSLDGTERLNCPSLQGASPRFDSDDDGLLTAEEISTRVSKYKSGQPHFEVRLFIEKHRRPVVGATVVCEPEPFLGMELPTYTGKTDSAGMLEPTTSTPSPGMVAGLYRVRISLPDGGQAIRGCEIADDVPSLSRLQISL